MKNASSYCNYNVAFKGYDSIRKPVGISETLDLLKKAKAQTHEITLLEGGFGTGACTEIICNHVKAIYGVEGSEEGCRKAHSKLCQCSNVFLLLGNILALPFVDSSFDAYMVHQVIHHLNPADNFRELKLFLKEAFRVLKSNGIIIINTCTPKHIDPENGVFWSYKFIPKAASELKRRYIPLDELKESLRQAGFTEIDTKKATGRFFKDSYYQDPLSVTDMEFCKGDSVYCFLTEEEIAKANAQITQACRDGSVFEEMERANKRFEDIGEAIVVYGLKG